MQKIHRWVARHGKLSFYILFPLNLVGLVGLHLLLNVPLWILVLYLFFCGIILWYTDAAFNQKFLEQASKQRREQCDPEPFYNEVTLQLGYLKNKVYRQQMMINLASAYRSKGEIDQAVKILESINIDQYLSTAPHTKCTYYNNLADIYMLQGQLEKGKIWLDKAMQLLMAVTDQKQHQQMEHILRMNKAELSLLEGQTDIARSILFKEEIRPDSRHQAVMYAYLMAAFYEAEGQLSSAAEQLRFVIQNGGKLYEVQQAQKRLAALERLPKGGEQSEQYRR